MTKEREAALRFIHDTDTKKLSVNQLESLALLKEKYEEARVLIKGSEMSAPVLNGNYVLIESDSNSNNAVTFHIIVKVVNA